MQAFARPMSCIKRSRFIKAPWIPMVSLTLAQINPWYSGVLNINKTTKAQPSGQAMPQLGEDPGSSHGIERFFSDKVLTCPDTVYTHKMWQFIDLFYHELKSLLVFMGVSIIEVYPSLSLSLHIAVRSPCPSCARKPETSNDKIEVCHGIPVVRQV